MMSTPKQVQCELLCSPFGSKPDDGDCGLYNGADRQDASAVTVPADMIAAAAASNADYAGSCGR